MKKMGELLSLAFVLGLVVSVSAHAKEGAKRKLAETAPATKFICGGTEPFWSLTIDGKKLTYKDPVLDVDNKKGETFTTAGAEGAQGIGNNHAVVYRTTNNKVVVTMLSAQMANGKCSDGMSEKEYGYHMFLIKGKNVYAGCCDASK